MRFVIMLLYCSFYDIFNVGTDEEVNAKSCFVLLMCQNETGM